MAGKDLKIDLLPVNSVVKLHKCKTRCTAASSMVAITYLHIGTEVKDSRCSVQVHVLAGHRKKFWAGATTVAAWSY